MGNASATVVEWRRFHWGGGKTLAQFTANAKDDLTDVLNHGGIVGGDRLTATLPFEPSFILNNFDDDGKLALNDWIWTRMHDERGFV